MRGSLIEFSGRLTAEPGVSHVWPGRPWPLYASVVFLNTEKDDYVEPAGWNEWHPGETRSIETAFYAEYHSSGPGSHTAERDSQAKKLAAAEAAGHDTKKFLAGSGAWSPAK